MTLQMKRDRPENIRGLIVETPKETSLCNKKHAITLLPYIDEHFMGFEFSFCSMLMQELQDLRGYGGIKMIHWVEITSSLDMVLQSKRLLDF